MAEQDRDKTLLQKIREISAVRSVSVPKDKGWRRFEFGLKVRYEKLMMP